MADPFSDAAITAALGRQMTRAVQRQAVAAGNLANLDTPGYRTKEVKFSEALDEQMGATLTATDPRHFGATVSADAPTAADSTGLAARRDGNNVQLDRELLQSHARRRGLHRGADRRWRRSSVWSATPSTKDANHVDAVQRHQRQRQRADVQRARMEVAVSNHRQRRVDAGRRRPAVPPARRRPRDGVDQLDRCGIQRPAPTASRWPASSKTSRRSAAGTSPRIPTRTPNGFVADAQRRRARRDGGHARRGSRVSGEPHGHRPDPRH